MNSLKSGTNENERRWELTRLQIRRTPESPQMYMRVGGQTSEESNHSLEIRESCTLTENCLQIPGSNSTIGHK